MTFIVDGVKLDIIKEEVIMFAVCLKIGMSYSVYTTIDLCMRSYKFGLFNKEGLYDVKIDEGGIIVSATPVRTRSVTWRDLKWVYSQQFNVQEVLCIGDNELICGIDGECLFAFGDGEEGICLPVPLRIHNSLVRYASRKRLYVTPEDLGVAIKVVRDDMELCVNMTSRIDCCFSLPDDTVFKVYGNSVVYVDSYFYCTKFLNGKLYRCDGVNGLEQTASYTLKEIKDYMMEHKITVRSVSNSLFVKFYASSEEYNVSMSAIFWSAADFSVEHMENPVFSDIISSSHVTYDKSLRTFVKFLSRKNIQKVSVFSYRNWLFRLDKRSLLDD